MPIDPKIKMLAIAGTSNLMPKAYQILDRRLYKKYGFGSPFFLKSQSDLGKLETVKSINNFLKICPET